MASKKRSNKKGTAAKDQASPHPDRLIYVHGIGNQEPLPQLKLLWDVALFGADMGDKSRMVYWADILHPPTKRTKTAKAKAKGAAGDTLEIDAALRDLGVDPRDPDVEALTSSLLRRLDLLHRVRTSSLGKRVLPLPRFLRRPIARAFLKSFIADTAAYFFEPGKRERIRKRLEAQLPADSGVPVTIITHSQGTIIALEVLADRAARRTPVNVKQWITLGSPLGIQEVQDFLSCGLEVPAGVARWRNFADPLDPVALDKGLANDFEPAGFVEDRMIVNERTKWLNPHSSLGYLSHPAVRKAVADSVRHDSRANFLVARDVAMLLGQPEDRHPVLIELLQPGYAALNETSEKRRAIEQQEAASEGGLSLETRIRNAESRLAAIVTDQSGKQAVAAARIDPLRRFVAARLTVPEILDASERHAELRIYRVWKNCSKRKLIDRSTRVVQADAAWASYAALGRGVEWAVLDTGVRSNHPHFENDVIAAVWDCTKPGPPVRLDAERKSKRSNKIERAATKDPDGHGTHVAGIIAGESEANGIRMRGAAPHARLHVYKVLDDHGAGEDAWIIKALDHIAARNESSYEVVIHGLNLSLGGAFDSTVYGCGFSPVCMELRRLWRDGTLVVVASGNEGKVDISTADGEVELNSPMSIGDPANLEDCIAVGSVHADKPHLYGISSFSSRGPTADGRYKPDVVAPGEQIKSCNAHFKAGDAKSLYRSESGTSMAAPHVSGLLAAFLSVRREFLGRPDEVKELLLRTCTDLNRDRYHQGHGVPNLMKMLLEA